MNVKKYSRLDRGNYRLIMDIWNFDPSGPMMPMMPTSLTQVCSREAIAVPELQGAEILEMTVAQVQQLLNLDRGSLGYRSSGYRRPRRL